MFISAGNGEVFPFARPMGVGLVEIAINLTNFLIKQKPDILVFVGTAGSYGKLTIFDIVESSSASQIELSFLQKKSYTPINNLITIEGVSKSNIIVNSSNYITTDFEIARKFTSLNIHLENMEFFSFLQVAKKFGIPAKGVFIITNWTNKNAHQDFELNRDEAMRRLTNYLKF